MIGQVQVKSSGIENSISVFPAADRGVNPGLAEGGDFLSILKSVSEFKDTRSAERDENSRKVNSEDKTPVQVSKENQPGPVESASYTKHESDNSNLQKTAETGNSLRSQPDRAEKNEIKKKSHESREESKEKRNDTDSLVPAAGEALVRKNISSRLKHDSDAKTAGDRFSKLHEKDQVKTAADIKNSEPHRIQQGNENPVHKNIQGINSGIKELLEASGKPAVKNTPVKKGMEQGNTGTGEFRESAVALTGSLLKEKVREDRGAETRKHKPSEAAAGDKKQETSEAVNTGRRMTVEQQGSGRGNSTGSDSGRENSQLFTGKSESLSRSASEKAMSVNRTPEFRQSLQEIIDRARITVSDSRNGSFTVKLFPKELGSVNVNLVMENGVVNGKFLVDNNDAKTALLSSIENLIDELQQSGVSVGEFSVNVRDGQERFVYQKDDQKHGINPAFNGNKEAVTAADVYDSNSVYKHNGSINMVI